MKFLLRDDDTCGMTRAEELQRCYAGIWDTVPVCLSVTPFIIPSGADWNPAEFRGKSVPVALDGNGEVVDFLREGLRDKRLDVALHGYHHLVTTPDPAVAGFDPAVLRIRGREYYYGDGLDEKTGSGKDYLERVLDYRINSFVPPGNAISKNGVRALVKHGLNLVGSPGWGIRFAAAPFDMRNHWNVVTRTLWKAAHGGHTNYPFVSRYAGGHQDVGYYTLYPSTELEALQREVDAVHAVGGVFVLGTHYHAFPTRIKSGETIEYALHALLDHVAGKTDVEYISYRELWTAPDT